MDKENQIRADRITAILAQFYAEDAECKKTSITDILADIRHFCSAHDIDMIEATSRSLRHYVAEAGPDHEKGF